MNIERIEDEGDFELARRSIPGSLGQIVLMSVFVLYTDYRHSHPLQLWLFALIIVVSNLLRFYLGSQQSKFYPQKRKLWFSLFAPTIWVPALAWGSLFFLVVRLEGLTHYSTTISLLIGSGISASIITSVSPNRHLGIAFITFVLGIPLVALLMSFERQSIGLSVIFMTYYLFLYFQLNIHCKSFWESVHNRRNLLEERNRLESVVEAIPGLVSWIGSDLKYHGVNRNFATYLASTPEELIQKDLAYKNPDLEFISAVREFIISSREDRATSEIYLSSGGKKRCHLLVMRKIHYHSNNHSPEEIYIICIDIHDLKQAQAELEQQRIRTELTSKLAALGEITAYMAHEIRNPLTVVTTATELIKKQSESSHDNKISSLADRVLTTSARINQIIDNLRGFSKSSEGEPYTVVNVAKVVKDSLDLVEQHFRNNSVLLHLEPTDLSFAIKCRPVELSQVLVNLLNNAIDAAKDQDQKWVRLKISGADSNVTISITDSGKGIPPNIAEQMFTPFFTTKPSGTGLGLSISRRIIERHGGTLEFDHSATNTTFVVSVPIARLA